MVHKKIPGSAILAPLGNLHNMQMKAAITDISFFDSNSLNIPRKGIKTVSIPMFSGSAV